MKGYIGLGVAGAIGLVALLAIGGSFYTVDQGEEAIILRNGGYVATETPGFHMKTPFIDNVVEYSLRQKTYTWDQMESYSNDQQPAHIRVSVTVQPVPGQGHKVYERYTSLDGFAATILTPRVPAVFKVVFGTYTAEGSIKKRGQLNTEFLRDLKADIDESLVQITSVQVEDISFSASYMASIDAKQQATVKVQEQQQLLAQEVIKAQISVTQANALADSQLAVATAEAKAIALKGDAEATAINLRGKALRENPNVIDLVRAEKWNGQLPTTMVPNSTVPFLDINP